MAMMMQRIKRMTPAAPIAVYALNCCVKPQKKPEADVTTNTKKNQDERKQENRDDKIHNKKSTSFFF